MAKEKQPTRSEREAPVCPPSEQIRDYLMGFDYFEKVGLPEVGQHYIDYHLQRFIRTLELFPPLEKNARILELGAAPFFMTALIQKYLGHEVTTASYYGDYGEVITEPKGHVEMNNPRYGEHYTFKYRVFNVERDPYPYPDGEFDAVLCCELFEHLAIDPSHLLREVHRTLKDGGLLFLTTPNVIRLEHIIQLARGRNIFHPYSWNGIYARHNREYTPDELARILRLHHFEASVTVEDAYRHGWFYRALTSFGPLRRRRDNLFAIGRAHDNAVQRYPDWLYLDLHNRPHKPEKQVVMSDRDASCLRSGWYDVEDWPPAIRWTAENATARLQLPDSRAQTQFGMRAAPGPLGSRGKVRIGGLDVGVFTIEPNYIQEVNLPVAEGLLTDVAVGEDGAVEVSIQIANPFVPAEVTKGSKDRRELGIAVESIWLR